MEAADQGKRRYEYPLAFMRESGPLGKQKMTMVQKLFYLLSVIACLPACNSGNGSGPAGNDSLAIRKTFASSPALSPEESLQKMQLEKGFSIQLAAAEPLVNSPVALTFDENGRLWVVEMQG